MTKTEPITDKFDDAQHFWMEQLAPANRMEKRLTCLIARQDYLMWASMQHAVELNQDATFMKCLRAHRELSATLDSLVHALSTLQRQRLALEPTPPPTDGTKAKVIPFPERSAAAKVGRPKKVQLDPEPVPQVAPFTNRYQYIKNRAAHPSLDLKFVA